MWTPELNAKPVFHCYNVRALPFSAIAQRNSQIVNDTFVIITPGGGERMRIKEKKHLVIHNNYLLFIQIK